MSIKNDLKIIKFGCYSVKNSDLKIKDRKGKLMDGVHNVFLIKKSKNGEKVKVKTITSLENISKDGKRRFHEGALESVRNGEIIVIPQARIRSKKLSGINRRPIWIKIECLNKPTGNYVFPKEYSSIISTDYKEKNKTGCFILYQKLL